MESKPINNTKGWLELAKEAIAEGAKAVNKAAMPANIV